MCTFFEVLPVRFIRGPTSYVCFGFRCIRRAAPIAIGQTTECFIQWFVFVVQVPLFIAGMVCLTARIKLWMDSKFANVHGQFHEWFDTRRVSAGKSLIKIYTNIWIYSIVCSVHFHIIITETTHYALPNDGKIPYKTVLILWECAHISFSLPLLSFYRSYYF